MDAHILRNPLLSVIANKEKWRQNVHQVSDSFSEANFPKRVEKKRHYKSGTSSDCKTFSYSLYGKDYVLCVGLTEPN